MVARAVKPFSKDSGKNTDARAAKDAKKANKAGKIKRDTGLPSPRKSR